MDNASADHARLEVRLVDYYNEQQAADLLQLLDGYACDPMGGGEPLSVYAREHLIGELRRRPHALSLIAYLREKPVGLLNAFEGFSTFAARPLINVHDLVVLKEYRGLQISQLLFDVLEKIARERGCCKLTLEVLHGNQIAQKAYRKFGFSPYELDPEMGQAMFWHKLID